MSLAPPSDFFDISGTSVSALQGFLDHAPDMTVRQSLQLMRPHLTGLTPAVLDNILVANEWEVAQIPIAGLVDEELKLAVRIFTVEAPYPVYRKFNDPFFDKARSPKLLEHYAPYAKLLLRATHALMKQPQFMYEGPAYRGIKVAHNADLKLKFDTYKSSFAVGSLMTLPAFTSVSLDDKVASGFGDHLLFTFTRVRGVRIRALSAVPQEAEVLVPPPSVHRILAVAMFHGSLVVTLECVESPLCYLDTSSPALSVTHPPLSAPSPAAKAASHAVGCVAPSGTGFLRAFGSKGTSNGQFKHPRFMALDHQDNIVVADDDNHRLQVFRLSDGAHLRTIGGPGSGAGQFATPKGVAFDAAGNIFVAESGNHRVQMLRYSDGSHVRTIGSLGSGSGQLNKPCGVAVDGEGNVLVHDGYCNGRIQVFRVSDGAHVRSICSKGSGPGQLVGYGCVTFDGQGNVVVSDSDNGRVQVLRYSDGALLKTIGSKGSGAGQFNRPYGVAFDAAGNIIVADFADHRVQVLRYSDGSHVRTIGSHGSGNGQFNWPYGVLIDSQGHIIVSDGDNHRIQVLQ